MAGEHTRTGYKYNDSDYITFSNVRKKIPCDGIVPATRRHVFLEEAQNLNITLYWLPDNVTFSEHGLVCHSFFIKSKGQHKIDFLSISDFFVLRKTRLK
jgi:hypothetical protein